MDIVEQLRSATVVVRKVDKTTYNYDSTLAKNAADEIERLRELVREAYDEGFHEGDDGGWIVGPEIPWKQSEARAALEKK